MSKIEKFGEFTNEGLKELAAKMRRTVTGQSAGDEIQKLPESQQQKLLDLYKQDPNEAAKYLRSIIIKEKNSQFGLGLALTIAGAAMIYKAANVEPPPPPPQDGKFLPADKGGITGTLNKYTGSDLNPKSSPEDFVKAVKDFGGGDYDKGVEFLTKGVQGPDKSEIITTLKTIGSDPHGKGDTLGDIFSGDWSGTGKTAGDLLDWPAGTKVWVKD